MNTVRLTGGRPPCGTVEINDPDTFYHIIMFTIKSWFTVPEPTGSRCGNCGKILGLLLFIFWNCVVSFLPERHDVIKNKTGGGRGGSSGRIQAGLSSFSKHVKCYLLCSRLAESSRTPMGAPVHANRTNPSWSCLVCFALHLPLALLLFSFFFPLPRLFDSVSSSVHVALFIRGFVAAKCSVDHADLRASCSPIRALPPRDGEQLAVAPQPRALLLSRRAHANFLKILDTAVLSVPPPYLPHRLLFIYSLSKGGMCCFNYYRKFL